MCKARLLIKDGTVVRRINEHTHHGDASKIEVLKAMTVLRDRSINTQDQTSQVIAASIQNLSRAGQGALPAMYSLKRTVQRKRLAVIAAPPNPGSLADLVIPQNFTRYESEPGQWENFLLFDSGRGSGQNRILIFSTTQRVQILERSSH